MSWEVKKLGEVCDFLSRGISPKYLDIGGIRVINQKCIRDHRVNYELTRRHNIDEKKVPYERFIRVGDVLVNSTGTGTLGRVAQVRSEPDEPTTVDSHVTIVRPIREMFLPDFFGYMLIKIEDEIKKSGEGCGGQTELARKKLAEMFNVSFPTSHYEQKRIVEILDQAFAQIDQAKALAEQNLKNAREVFDNFSFNAFSNSDYEETPLEHLIEVLTDYHANGSYKILKQHVALKETEDYAWMVRSTDFEKEFKNDKRYISESAYNYLKKTPLFGGEIIMSKIGNAGKVYLMPKVNRPCSLAMNLFLLRLNPSKANNEYVFRYLNSLSGKFQIQPMLKGAATQTITKDAVRSLKIPLPKLSTQKDMVKMFNHIEKQTRDLENIYRKKLKALDELKQSLLQKAFSGDLTANLDEVA